MSYRYQGPESDERISLLRLVLVVVPLIIAAAGLAPVGLAAVFSKPSWIGYAVIPFWIVLIASAFIALGSKKSSRASKATVALWLVAILNLGGCAVQLAGIGHATQ